MKELYNKELEQEILGCIFLGDEPVKKILNRCNKSDFYYDKFKKIFEVVKEKTEDGSKIDVYILQHALGNEYLDSILDIFNKGLTDINLEQHIKMLKELSHKRKLRAIKDGDLEEIKKLYEEIERENTIIDYNPIISISDILKTVFEYYKKGNDRGVGTGWDELDDYYTVSKSQFTILTGIPFSGKSEWLDHLLVNLADREKWKFAVFSPENFPVNRHIKKLIEKRYGFPFFDGYEERISIEDLKIGLNWINEHFYFLNPSVEDRNIDFLLRQIRTLCIEKNIDGFVLDPWNEIEHARNDKKTETEYISECLSKFRYFVRNYNIHLWIVAHPTKLQRDKDGNYPVPTPYDISGSANWRNKADNCITIHRPDLSRHEIELHVQKVRFKDNGHPGMIKLKYNRVNGRFTE